jgi:hypothetical protein
MSMTSYLKLLSIAKYLARLRDPSCAGLSVPREGYIYVGDVDKLHDLIITDDRHRHFCGRHDHVWIYSNPAMA